MALPWLCHALRQAFDAIYDAGAVLIDALHPHRATPVLRHLLTDQVVQVSSRLPLGVAQFDPGGGHHVALLK
eukprot:1139226-Pyramimonas_sp.AAC.1